MTIIRRKRYSHYAVRPNAIWEDDRIGADEKGVLGYLLSRPPTWNVNLWNVGKTMKIGKDRIQRILRALIAAGYISRRVIRNENGIITSLEYVVRDEPETGHAIPHSVVVETPSDAFVSAPQMENPAPAEQAPGRAAGYKERKILSTDHTKHSSLAESSPVARATPDECNTCSPRNAAGRGRPLAGRRRRSSRGANAVQAQRKRAGSNHRAAAVRQAV